MAARIARFALAFLLLGATAAPDALARDRKTPAQYAVVAGTVFRDSGLSLAGAEVVLEQVADAASNSSRKLKKVKQTADARGEFAFRVPAAPADYRVSVKASGYQGEEKQVSVHGEERLDVFFRLAPASK